MFNNKTQQALTYTIYSHVDYRHVDRHAGGVWVIHPLRTGSTSAITGAQGQS